MNDLFIWNNNYCVQKTKEKLNRITFWWQDFIFQASEIVIKSFPANTYWHFLFFLCPLFICNCNVKESVRLINIFSPYYLNSIYISYDQKIENIKMGKIFFAEQNHGHIDQWNYMRLRKCNLLLKYLRILVYNFACFKKNTTTNKQVDTYILNKNVSVDFFE